MKKILIVLAILVVLVIGSVVGLVAFGLSQINTIAKETIQRGGTYATGVTTTVDTVDIKLFDGTFAMNGFQLANPDGFDTPHFFLMGGTNVNVNTGSITEDVIQVPSVTLQGIDVILDKGNDPSNYNYVLNNLKRFESGETPDAAPENQGGPKIAVDSLVLDGIDIRVANVPGLSMVAGDVAITIPRIELQDVGKEGALSPAELINLIVKTVMTAAIENGGGILPADMLGELGNGLAGLTSLSEMGVTAIGDAGQIVGEQMNAVLENAGVAVEELGKGATDAVGKVGEEVGKGVDDAAKQVEDEINKAGEDLKKGIGNLLGGNKEDDEP